MGLFGFGKKKKEEGNGPDLLKQLMDQVGLPFTILSGNMGPEQVMNAYREALERGKREGFTPVILGASDEILLECFGDYLQEDGKDREENVKKMLAEISDGREFLKEAEEGYGEWNELPEGVVFTEKLLGRMEKGETIQEFTAIFDYGSPKKLRHPCAIVEVPTKNPWEVVVYLPFGGWNDCPAPEYMAGVCKYWYEKYGAVPAVITNDTLEFYLETPVKEEDAMELAKEQFLFCTDRVFQGTQTNQIGEVADCLRKSTVWYFWWD